MSCSSDSDTDGEPISVVPCLALPRCRCGASSIYAAVRVPDEQPPRCDECLNLIVVPDIETPKERWVVLARLLIWRRFGWVLFDFCYGGVSGIGEVAGHAGAAA